MKENLADKITGIIGSWKFLILQTIILVLYVGLNVAWFFVHFDPFPFIFLNLILSFQAAYTAPIILMSHNRMAERDRDLAKLDRENNARILQSIEKLEKTLIKEVDQAVEEITEAIEEDDEDDSENK